MSHYLTLHITDTTARMMLAISDAKTVRVRNAAELSADDANGLRAQIKDKVTEWNCAGVATLYALNRDQCEIRRLPVPDVGKDELPDLVRYQAVQNFSALAPDAQLDFVPLPHAKKDEGRFVLAGAITPERMKELDSLCEHIGCPLEGVILRPCATAALVHDVMPGSRGSAQVVVDHHRGVIELLVMLGPKAILMRSVRLPGSDPHENTQTLVSEVKRTIAAATSSHTALKVSEIIVCGNDADDEIFAKAIRDQGGMSVRLLENWSGSRIHKSLPDKPIENAGGFLPLIGLVKAEVAKEDSVIDFRRPRQRPPAPDYSGRYKLFGVLALATIAAAVFGIRYLLGEQDRQIAALTQRASEQKHLVEKSDARLNALSDMQLWHARSLNWLDEFNYLSKQLPAAEKVQLKEINCIDRGVFSKFADSPSRGHITMKGGVDRPATVPRMHSGLRNERHRLSAGDLTTMPSEPKYRVRFDDSLFVAPSDTIFESAPDSESESPDPETSFQWPEGGEQEVDPGEGDPSEPGQTSEPDEEAERAMEQKIDSSATPDAEIEAESKAESEAESEAEVNAEAEVAVDTDGTATTKDTPPETEDAASQDDTKAASENDTESASEDAPATAPATEARS